MALRGYAAILAFVLFAVLQKSLAAPDIQRKIPFVAEYPGCPMYQVGQSRIPQKVTLVDKLTFVVKPNLPILVMDIETFDQELYQAAIDGSMIKLYRCNVDHSQCSILKQEGSKSTNLLDVGKWNYVNVSFVDDVVTVSVNAKVNVMGKRMVMTPVDDSQHQSGIQVMILGPKDTTADPSVSAIPPNYNVDVNTLCNGTYSPLVEPVSVQTDQTTGSRQPPYPECPQYEVLQGDQQYSVRLEDSLTLALFPTKPVMCLHIFLHDDMYKATVDGTMLHLSHCQMDGTSCEILTQGGAKDSALLSANTWNYVSLSFVSDVITVSVNNKANVMRKAMSVRPGIEHADVVVVASEGISAPTATPSGYKVSVNIACNDTFHPQPEIRSEVTDDPNPVTPIVGPTTPGNEHVTEKSTGDTPDGEGEGSSNRTVLWVLLGIMAVVLVAVVVGLLVNRYLKNRSGAQRLVTQQEQR